jgi:serine protease Do
MAATAGAGRKVALAVRRGTAVMRLTTTLAADPDEAAAAKSPPPPPGHASPLGMAVSEVTTGLARQLGLPDTRGVVVVHVEPGSPASEAGLERGDLVLRVADTPVLALEDYGRAARAVAHGGLLRMLLRRNNKDFWAAFEKR